MQASFPAVAATSAKRPDGAPTGEITLRSRHLMLLMALLAAIALVYWPGLGGGFALDDYPNIVDNMALHVTRPIWSDWLAAIFSSPSNDLVRPLAMLSFAINHYFTGLDPRPMKLTNIAIHLLNALLVLGLVGNVLQAASPVMSSERRQRIQWAAWFAAASWAMHPINLMAVLFIVQRMESLSHTFVFAGLWMYVAGRLRQQRGLEGWGLILAGLIPCTALGLLAKESAVLLPLYAFCLEVCVFRFRGSGVRNDKRLYALFACVLLLPAIVGLIWLLPYAIDPSRYAGREFTLTERLMTEPRVVLDYLRWIVLPDLNQLSLYHDDYVISRALWTPGSTLLGIVAIPLVLAIAWFCRWRRPLVSLGLLWFLAGQLLTATIVPLELVFEHRNYFASLGICLVLADLLLLAPVSRGYRRIGAALAVAFVFLGAGTTYLRAEEWSNPVRFSSTEAAKHPESPRAVYGIARTLANLSSFDPESPFVPETLVALERARRLPQSNSVADYAALIFAARVGSPVPPEWWRDLQAKLRRRPLGQEDRAALGALTDCVVKRQCPFPPSEMLETFAAAMSQESDARTLSIYGNYALNALGDADLASRVWQEASALEPKKAKYRIDLAELMMALGRGDEAKMQIAALRRLGQFGQFAAVADSLEARLLASLKARNRPGNQTSGG